MRTSNNYVSNEVIVAGWTVADIWPCLKNTSVWTTYYRNVADIRFHDGMGRRAGTRGLRVKPRPGTAPRVV
jgi:hypothetical protein